VRLPLIRFLFGKSSRSSPFIFCEKMTTLLCRQPLSLRWGAWASHLRRQFKRSRNDFTPPHSSTPSIRFKKFGHWKDPKKPLDIVDAELEEGAAQSLAPRGTIAWTLQGLDFMKWLVTLGKTNDS
jgi:hypothetical protein